MPARPRFRIAGGGPAGLVAAIQLARSGCRVEVFERRRDCGARFRGDLQGIENWSSSVDALEELQNLGITLDFSCTPFYTLTHTNGRRAVVHRFHRPAFYLVKRGTAPDTLDQSLKRQALEAGVMLRFGQALSPGEADLVATGPGSRKIFAVDCGIVFETDAPDRAVVLTRDSAGVKGYSYLLVAKNCGCLCTVLFDQFDRARECLRQARRILLEQYPLDFLRPRRTGGVGRFCLPPELQEGKTLLVGEAAGLQDFLWGFGIRTAIRSGHLAAQSLLEGGDYVAQASRQFSPQLRAGVVNRFLWELLRVGEYRLVMAILYRGGLPLLQSFYGYNVLQRILFPLARRVLRRRYPQLGMV